VQGVKMLQVHEGWSSKCKGLTCCKCMEGGKKLGRIANRELQIANCESPSLWCAISKQVHKR